MKQKCKEHKTKENKNDIDYYYYIWKQILINHRENKRQIIIKRNSRIVQHYLFETICQTYVVSTNPKPARKSQRVSERMKEMNRHCTETTLTKWETTIKITKIYFWSWMKFFKTRNSTVCALEIAHCGIKATHSHFIFYTFCFFYSFHKSK